MLICFLLVLCTFSAAIAQDQPPSLEERLRILVEQEDQAPSLKKREDQFRSLSQDPFSKHAEQPESPIKKIDDWKNGKYSPDAYKVKSSDDEETRLSY